MGGNGTSAVWSRAWVRARSKSGGEGFVSGRERRIGHEALVRARRLGVQAVGRADLLGHAPDPAEHHQRAGQEKDYGAVDCQLEECGVYDAGGGL